MVGHCAPYLELVQLLGYKMSRFPVLCLRAPKPQGRETGFVSFGVLCLAIDLCNPCVPSDHAEPLADAGVAGATV